MEAAPRARPRPGATEVVLDRRTAKRDYDVGDSATGHRHDAGGTQQFKLVGIARFGGIDTTGRRDVGAVRPAHRRRVRARQARLRSTRSSSAATARVSQTGAGRPRSSSRCPDDSQTSRCSPASRSPRRHRTRHRSSGSASSRMFLTIFALIAIFVGMLRHLQRVQDHRGATPAARTRCSAPSGAAASQVTFARCSSRRSSSASCGSLLGFVARRRPGARASLFLLLNAGIGGPATTSLDDQADGVRHHVARRHRRHAGLRDRPRRSAPDGCRRWRRCATSPSTAPARPSSASSSAWSSWSSPRSGSPLGLAGTTVLLGARRRRPVRRDHRLRPDRRRADRQRSPRRLRGIGGVTGRIAGRNAARNPKRTALTAGALGVGLALLVARVDARSVRCRHSVRDQVRRAVRRRLHRLAEPAGRQRRRRRLPPAWRRRSTSCPRSRPRPASAADARQGPGSGSGQAVRQARRCRRPDPGGRHARPASSPRAAGHRRSARRRPRVQDARRR